MRFIILILAILFSCSSFGQDSLQIDTSSKPSILTSQDPVFADSVSDTLKKSVVNKKKQKNKAKKIKAQEAPISDDLENRGDVYVSENYNGAIIIFLIIIGVIAFLVFHRSIPATT